MSRYLKSVITVGLIVAVMGLFLLPFGSSQSASACGYGTSGGGDYVPQRRGSSGYTARKSAITQEQARELATPGFPERVWDVAPPRVRSKMPSLMMCSFSALSPSSSKAYAANSLVRVGSKVIFSSSIKIIRSRNYGEC